MKNLRIGDGAFINDGALAGLYGKVVAIDSDTGKASLQIDEDTTIVVPSTMVEQE